ncbi:hypothetical protein D3C78_1518600 [compost metagenome]
MDRLGVILAADQGIGRLGQALRLAAGNYNDAATAFERRFETGQVSAARTAGKSHGQSYLALVRLRVGTEPVANAHRQVRQVKNLLVAAIGRRQVIGPLGQQRLVVAGSKHQQVFIRHRLNLRRLHHPHASRRITGGLAEAA